jgi:hypothetical protein
VADAGSIGIPASQYGIGASFRVFTLLKYFYRIKKSMEHVLDSYRLNYSKYYNYPSCDRYFILKVRVEPTRPQLGQNCLLLHSDIVLPRK